MFNHVVIHRWIHDGWFQLSICSIFQCQNALIISHNKQSVPPSLSRGHRILSKLVQRLCSCRLRTLWLVPLFVRPLLRQWTLFVFVSCYPVLVKPTTQV
ncbi:hypothetical protein BT69DRAFT_284630 [Atractiella rhizophila]|nr:hypothetical protein BT69DRAFT_284630 [Atractiella rhizophila]